MKNSIITCDHDCTNCRRYCAGLHLCPMIADEIPAVHNRVDTLSRRATVGTLKRIHAASGNDTVGALRNGVFAGLSALDNVNADELCDTSALDLWALDTIPEGMDCYHVAYEYLWERLVVCGYDAQSVISVRLKNGTLKERTVAQWACVAVRRYVYSNGNAENKSKYIYIEDLTAESKDGTLETGLQALDRIYIRAGKYHDIQDFTEYGTERNFLAELAEYGITPGEKTVMEMRLRGLSTVVIADRLGITHQAVSKRLAHLQKIVERIHPEAVRAFKEKRGK